jgi:protein gp37
MKNSKIEWTDCSFNPWIGCSKVSPGCAHCYAEALNRRMGWTQWGDAGERFRTSPHNWHEPRRWDREAAKSGQRIRVFCASLADWLDAKVPNAWRVDLLALIDETPNLDWLLLTKRPIEWRARMHKAKATGSPLAHSWLNGVAPANVWVGTSIEDQHRADGRIPALVAIPARIRFLSCEPLLGPLALPIRRQIITGFPKHISADGCAIGAPLSIHWTICGGESGPGARPMHPDWARSLRDQCAAAGVAFFMKQMGGTRKPFDEIPSDLLVREFPEVTQCAS